VKRPSLGAHHRQLPAIAVVLLLGWWGAPQPIYCQDRISIAEPSHERYGALQQPVLRPDTIADASVTEIVTQHAPPRSDRPQDTGTQTPSDQTQTQTQTQGQAQAQANPNPNPAATYQPVTWKNLPVRVLGDQKLVWLFPMHIAQGQHLLPTLGIVGVTGGLIAADSHIMVHLRNNTAPFHEFDKIFSGTNTGALTALIPAAFYIYGVAAKSTYSEQTALLAGEAYLDSAIPHVAMKLVSRRLRPNAVPAANDFSDTFFKSKVSVFGKGSSFPSGHAAGIFSIATVVAERYRHYRWVPWVAYGLAAAISFSRVPDFAHFPSDVFMGAALGYTITRYDVLRDRTH
jgi:membrane-associated phospholipid phosphatase